MRTMRPSARFSPYQLHKSESTVRTYTRTQEFFLPVYLYSRPLFCPCIIKLKHYFTNCNGFSSCQQQYLQLETGSGITSQQGYKSCVFDTKHSNCFHF